MIINISVDEEKTTFQLAGRLDNATAMDLHDDLIMSFDTSKEVVLDLAELQFVSTAGLRVILIGEKQSRNRNAKMKLINVSSDVMEILDMTGLSEKITIE